MFQLLFLLLSNNSFDKYLSTAEIVLGCPLGMGIGSMTVNKRNFLLSHSKDRPETN